MKEIFINMKSGNPVVIVPNTEEKLSWTKGMTPVRCVTVERIDCDKKLISPLSSLKPLQKFIEDGGELGSHHLRLIELIQKNN